MAPRPALYRPISVVKPLDELTGLDLKPRSELAMTLRWVFESCSGLVGRVAFCAAASERTGGVGSG